MGISDANAAVRKLNAVYMRVARWIAGNMQYGQRDCATSFQVREKLGIPCIECKMRQLGLKYFVRMSVHGPCILNTLLACRGPDGAQPRLPWTKQILNNLCIAKAAWPHALGACRLPNHILPIGWTSFAGFLQNGTR